MKLFVVGNINAGKSHIIDKLSKLYPNYKVLKIDDFRKKYSDGTIEKEIETRKIFADEILECDDCLIEFSGGETITRLFVDRLRKNSVVVLEVLESVETCISRIKGKDFSLTPYPSYSESLEDTIGRLDLEFKNRCIKNNFDHAILIHYQVNSNCTIDELPLKQYELTIKLVNNFEGKHDCLFCFGSLGRRNISIYSDIDLFLKTDVGLNIVKKQILEIFPGCEIIMQKSSIGIFIDDNLIEINVIKRLEEAMRFYSTSLINKVEETILLGDSELENKLKRLLKEQKYSFKEEFIHTISRLRYYVKSLPILNSKNDLYKFYFHNNIVVHEYIKLQYFLKGYRNFSYLPNNAHNLVDITTWDILIYTYKKDCLKHCEDLNLLVNIIVSKANDYLQTLND